jgi:hypothetical protein
MLVDRNQPYGPGDDVADEAESALAGAIAHLETVAQYIESYGAISDRARLAQAKVAVFINDLYDLGRELHA